MQINIECEYCGSLYDYNEHSCCPNCAAVPNKKQITAAKNTAKQQTTAASAGKPTGRFMTFLIKCIPLWIFLIIFSAYIPEIAEKNMTKNASKSFQTVNEINYAEHSMNENFLYEDVLSLNVDDAYFADTVLVNELIPEDKRLLVVHINASVEDCNILEDADLDYYNISYYITNGEYCRSVVSSHSLDAVPDAFAQNFFSLSSCQYHKESDGFWCFIVDKDDTDFSLCIEEVYAENYSLHLDKVHKINIDINEKEDVE